MSHDVKLAQFHILILSIMQNVEPVYPATEAPREQVVAYIKALAKEASEMPKTLLLGVQRIPAPDGTGSFTEGKGYDIACSLTSATLQDWIIDENGDLAEISGIAGQLEIEPENKQLWNELLEKVDNLNA